MVQQHEASLQQLLAEEPAVEQRRVEDRMTLAVYQAALQELDSLKL